MNAKHSRSIRRWAALLGLVLCAQQTYSQEIYDWEAWGEGRTIAGKLETENELFYVLREG